MHKLVHAWGYDRLSNSEERELSLAALGLLTGFMRAFRGHLTHELRLVPHAMANFGIIRTAHGSSDGLGEVGLESVAVVSDFLLQLGRWGDEYEVRAFHLRKVKDVAGKEHPYTLTSMNNLALVLSSQGRYEQAEEIHCRGEECESVAKARIRNLSHRVDWQVEGGVRREYTMTRGLMIGATTVLASMESSVCRQCLFYIIPSVLVLHLSQPP